MIAWILVIQMYTADGMMLKPIEESFATKEECEQRQARILKEPVKSGFGRIVLSCEMRRS